MANAKQSIIQAIDYHVIHCEQEGGDRTVKFDISSIFCMTMTTICFHLPRYYFVTVVVITITIQQKSRVLLSFNLMKCPSIGCSVNISTHHSDEDYLQAGAKRTVAI